MRASTGVRGKYAESKVRAFLALLNEKYKRFDFSRIYDARSAGGRFPSRPGDFEFYAPGLHGLIEVKEVEHDFRLPAKNLKPEQIAKLRKREWAGGLVMVLIYHATAGGWRRVPVSWLAERAAQPSWDLSEFPTYGDVQTALLPLTATLGAEAV